MHTPAVRPAERCTETVTGEYVHAWWPVQHRCTKPLGHRGAHVEDSPNSVAGGHVLIWRAGETPKLYWYPASKDC